MVAILQYPRTQSHVRNAESPHDRRRPPQRSHVCRFSGVDLRVVRSGPATIAVFPRPPSRGRARGVDALDRDDSGQLIGNSPEIVERRRRARPHRALAGDRHAGRRIGHRQGDRRRVPARAAARAPTDRSSPSTAARFPPTWSKPSCSATSAARSPAPRGSTRAISSARRAARCFSTKLPKCRSTCRRSCCACSNPGAWSASAAPRRSRSTCAIVTATNHAPETIIRDRRLREDLYYRLAVFVVRLPPLRQRGDDIALLAQVFLDRLNRRIRNAQDIRSGSLALARAHSWPGNVRELKNCVERSFVLSDDVVTLDLHPIRHGAVPRARTCASASASPSA